MAPPLNLASPDPPQCLRDVACGHNRIHSTWRLSVIEATFPTNPISELNRAAV